MAKRGRAMKSSEPKKIINVRCPYCGLNGVDVTINPDGSMHIKCSFCQEERTFVRRPRSDGKTMKITDSEWVD